VTDLRVLIADVPDREYVVVEIWRDSLQIAEVSRGREGCTLEMYCHGAGDSVAVDLESFSSALAQAREILSAVDLGD
jgi:hypothetical protein